MPLCVNVGLSRKASKDYQSAGVSINVTAELDPALLARPEQLQQQIANLYEQARAALNRQAHGQDRPESPAASDDKRNGDRPTTGSDGHGPTMTINQRRTIAAIAGRLGLDEVTVAKDVLGIALDDLTVRQASLLIDHLKSLGLGDARGMAFG